MASTSSSERELVSLRLALLLLISAYGPYRREWMLARDARFVAGGTLFLVDFTRA
jgi:hypothetical protein